MDYSKLSDHEINKMVAISLGKDVMPDDCQDFGISGFPEVMLRSGDIKNYCNDASDAWPIIQKNLLRVVPVSFIGKVNWVVSRDIHSNHDANPLRAAMITFLMMQDSANVQDNTA